MTSIYIKTFGCSLNKADSQIMESSFKKVGFTKTEDETKADIIILNSCTVKTPTENKFFSLLKKYDKKKVIITGCIAQTTPEKLSGYTLVGTSNPDQIVEAIEETLNKNPMSFLVKEDKNKAIMPQENNHIGIIPIAEGCLGNCTYCLVKLARGNLNSYPIKDIISKLREFLRHGAKEIWLTAQDTGCYGLDIGTTLPELLKEVISVPGNFIVRLGMSNPQYIKNYLPELIEIYKSKKIFKFIHIPVQSGSNKILETMNRQYKKEDFIEIVIKLREEYPLINIATDIICGFPGETKEDFEETLELIKETTPDVVNISKYWERPKTKSKEFKKKVSPEEIKNRTRRLKTVFEWISHTNNKKWIGWEGKILINEYGKDNTTIGRNFAYKEVIIKHKLPLGTATTVKIKNAEIYYLIAESN